METKDLKELRSLRAEQVEVAEKAITEEKPEEAKSALEQIKELDARIEKVEKEVKEIKDEEGKDEPKEEDKTNEEPKAQEGEQRNMTQFKPEVSENKLSAEVRGFAEFLTSKGEVRDNITSLNSEAVIPQDVVTQPVQLPETITNLKDYVNVIKVPTAQGSYPILESATERMISVEELAKNPEL